MQKLSPPPQRTGAYRRRRSEETKPRRDEEADEELNALEEAVEAAATAYFQTCRKLARAISHFKK